MHDSRERYPLLWDEEWLRQRYVVEMASTPEIAAEVGCSASRVQQRLHTLEIPVRGRHFGNWKPKTCQRCGVEYTPSGPAQKFCTQACSKGTSNCLFCGTEFVMNPANSLNNYCSRRHYWEHKKAEGKQGRYLTDGGYIRLSVPEGTPGRQADGRMPEHRYVMQAHLGRPIRKDEDVHHRNGSKTDNRLDNLELWSGSQPRGQRVIDKVEWAREILDRYEAEIAAGLI